MKTPDFLFTEDLTDCSIGSIRLCQNKNPSVFFKGHFQQEQHLQLPLLSFTLVDFKYIKKSVYSCFWGYSYVLIVENFIFMRKSELYNPL